MKYLFSFLFLIVSTAYGQVYQPATFHYNGFPVNGVKIKTNLPFTAGSHMPTIIIEGYNYYSGEAIGLIVNYYIYNPNDVLRFFKYNVSSYGAYTPVIKLANENDKVVIFIDSKDYFQRFMVRAFSKGISEQTSWFDGWTIVDEALTGTQQVTVPYRNRFKDEVFFDGKVAIKTGQPGGFGFINNANNYVNSINSIYGTDSTQAHLSFRVGTANANMYNLSERMRIDTDGNVGIGTSTPNSKLDVNGILTLSSGSILVNSIIPAVNVNGTARTMRFGYNSSIVNEGFQFYNSNTSTNLMMIQGNGNVGIGTSSPTAPLHVQKGIAGNYAAYINNTDNGTSSNGLRVDVANNNSNNTVQRWYVAGSEVMRIQADGKLGIGTATPSAKLDVRTSTSSAAQTNPIISARGVGNSFEFGHPNAAGYVSTIGANSSNGRPFLCFNCEAGATNDTYKTRGIVGTIVTPDLSGGLIVGRVANSNADNQGVTTDMILKGGQIGIGTSNIPVDYKMAIAGNVIAEKIKVKKQVNGAWPDYVFSPTYKLQSLEELEKFTKENSRLPEIPSAKEIEKDGQDLGEMNRLLLKKVEELTLYMIEQNKNIIQQNNEIKALKLKVEQLEKK